MDAGEAKASASIRTEASMILLVASTLNSTAMKGGAS
jgi:hypothetical protein